jgi:hypothetical protein
MMRATLPALLALSLLSAPALAQRAASGPSAVPDNEPPPQRTAEAATAEFCGFLRNQMTQADQMLRQFVATINQSSRTDNPTQLAARASNMDQWTGRLAAYIDTMTQAQCLEPAQIDQARSVIAQYGAFATQAREYAMRPQQQAAAQGQGAAAPQTPAERRRARNAQERRALDLQESTLNQ